MLIEYIHAAMRRATYRLDPGGDFYGDIPGFPGVWSCAPTLEACRDDLQSVLEGWIILGLRLGHDLPIINTLNLTPKLEPIEDESELEEAA